MSDYGLSFDAKWDLDLARKLSSLDPDSPFPEIEYAGGDFAQELVFIELFGQPIGFSLVVNADGLELFRFFIAPRHRGTGISILAARGLLDFIFSDGYDQLVLTAIDEHSYRFWRRALETLPHREVEGEDKFIVFASR